MYLELMKFWKKKFGNEILILTTKFLSKILKKHKKIIDYLDLKWGKKYKIAAVKRAVSTASYLQVRVRLKNTSHDGKMPKLPWIAGTLSKNIEFKF